MSICYFQFITNNSNNRAHHWVFFEMLDRSLARSFIRSMIFFSLSHCVVYTFFYVFFFKTKYLLFAFHFDALLLFLLLLLPTFIYYVGSQANICTESVYYYYYFVVHFDLVYVIWYHQGYSMRCLVRVRIFTYSRYFGCSKPNIRFGMARTNKNARIHRNDEPQIVFFFRCAFLRLHLYGVQMTRKWHWRAQFRFWKWQEMKMTKWDWQQKSR